MFSSVINASFSVWLTTGLDDTPVEMQLHTVQIAKKKEELYILAVRIKAGNTYTGGKKDKERERERDRPWVEERGGYDGRDNLKGTERNNNYFYSSANSYYFSG